MTVSFKNGKITIRKEMNQLDQFVLDFTSVLDSQGIKYVLISGYVSILFGRNRTSEDIDIIVERIDYEKFIRLWNALDHAFECIITGSPEDCYKEYLADKHAVRFALKGRFIPNMEMKFPKNELDVWVLQNHRRVSVNSQEIFISPLELQISFKLFLGSEKDIEDAKFLYELFKDKIDMNMLDGFNRQLKVLNSFERYMK